MYRCSKCGAVQPPRTPGRCVVVARRPKVYPFRREAFFRVKWENGKKKKKKVDDPGGIGHEIAREALCCPPCAATAP